MAGSAIRTSGTIAGSGSGALAGAWLYRCRVGLVVGTSRVGAAVGRKQALFLLELGEAEEDQDDAERDRDSPRCVGPLVALEEGLLGGGDDSRGVLRVLLGDRFGAVEGLGEFALHAGGDLAGVG